VQLKFPDTEENFVFIGTHLDHLRDPVNRNVQAEALAALVDQYQNTPAILAGDLNSLPDSDAMKTIRGQWMDAWPANREAGTNSRRNRRIDYVLYTPSSGWKVTRTYRGTDIKTGDKEWQDLLTLASDHLPVMAEMEIVD
jgi:endonuclease/exonuclease/phosphatase family metal-dependent hydrolase